MGRPDRESTRQDASALPLEAAAGSPGTGKRPADLALGNLAASPFSGPGCHPGAAFYYLPWFMDTMERIFLSTLNCSSEQATY